MFNMSYSLREQEIQNLGKFTRTAKSHFLTGTIKQASARIFASDLIRGNI